MAWVPLVARVPLQPPEAVQDDAFWEVQVSVEVPPSTTVVAEAVNVTVGAVAVTTTSVDCVAEPPGPVQVIVYVVVAAKGTVAAVPEVARVPVQPPDAVQDCEFADAHCRLAVLPALTVLSAAVSVTVGAGKALVVTVALATPPILAVEEP